MHPTILYTYQFFYGDDFISPDSFNLVKSFTYPKIVNKDYFINFYKIIIQSTQLEEMSTIWNFYDDLFNHICLYGVISYRLHLEHNSFQHDRYRITRTMLFLNEKNATHFATVPTKENMRPLRWRTVGDIEENQNAHTSFSLPACHGRINSFSGK